MQGINLPNKKYISSLLPSKKPYKKRNEKFAVETEMLSGWNNQMLSFDWF